MKVVVDVYGGDNAPDEIIKGCMQALDKNSKLTIVMCGYEDEIKQKLTQYTENIERVEIVNATEVITNDDVPTDAIRTKKQSSLVVALEKVKADDECIGLVSAGSTGAVLTGSFLKIGRIKGIMRPALAPLLPTIDGKEVLLIDCGANVDCKPQMLVQFAHMGTAYMKSVKRLVNPRVALLSNGTEDKKGNDFTKEVFGLLKNESNINFVGNMEARDILSGEYDVIVTDGFYGNIALKTCEGTATTMLKMIKKEITSGFKNKIGALLLKGAFKKVKATMDYNSKGGAPFVGLTKLVIKAHGSSKASSINGAINQVIEMNKGHLIEKIVESLPKVDNVTD